jgi:pimeloyl-ACP methyl ester carboxylesterase
MGIALDTFRAAVTQELQLSGMVVRYRVLGDGPPLLFLHGWPLCGATYRELAYALQPHFRCYIPDLPGAGDTPWAPQIQDTGPAFTQLMREFVDALGLSRFAIVAHDSGGAVGRMLAAELDGRVSALILQNTEVPDYVAPLARLVKVQAQYAPGLTAKALASPAFRRSALGFGGTFGDRSLIDGEFHEACVVPLLRAPQGALDMFKHFDLTFPRRVQALHARISAPISLFWGGADTFFPVAAARAMFDGLRQRGEMHVEPNAKLYVHEECPAQLARFALPILRAAFDSLVQHASP